MYEKISKTRTCPSQRKNIPTCQNQPWAGMVKTMIFLIKIKIKINRFDIDFTI